MLVILLGPPGAGKGTQAEHMVEKYKLTHISTGNILRSSVKRGTDLGKKAREFMDKGELVPDDVVVGIVKERLQEPDCTSGALLDGFPRTVVQAHSLEEVLNNNDMKINAVLYIDVKEEELVSRLTGRRVCRECGATYHLKFHSPQVRNVCDQCGGELYQRDDDSLATVRQRIDVYRNQTEPLIEFYREKGMCYLINGNQEISQVFEAINKALEQAGSF